MVTVSVTQPQNESVLQTLFQPYIYINFFGFSGVFLFFIGLILLLIYYIKSNKDEQKIKDRNVAIIVTCIGGLLFVFTKIGSKIFEKK